MHCIPELTGPARLAITGLTGLAGGVTAFLITEIGGSMRHYLPETGFHMAAVVGAALAGFILADGMGRPGTRGIIWALFTAASVTLLGAWIGALLLMPFGAGIGTGVLGLITLAEAISADPLISKLWMAAMVILQLAAAAVRAGAERISL